jgi:saccharopine dehydrogenase-like NADP-dependent oxidoreductase
MSKKVLIIGGRGRIGSSVAKDLANFTDAEITITGRDTSAANKPLPAPGVQYLALNLADNNAVKEAIQGCNVVVHCAGPFQYRDTSVLKNCIDEGVNYVDVSDSRGFTSRALELKNAAKDAGITAIINTGIFPGISNSMVRAGVEKLDQADRIHLSYVVGSSGGAGLTVMRTTFLGLQNPFDVLIDGKWKQIKPYTGRETIKFPAPYGNTGVYWFDMPEAFTLPDSFPQAKTVITKFGTSPDLYNHLTWFVANLWPQSWVKNPAVVEFLSHVSYNMTKVTDAMVGTGVAVRSEVNGIKDGKPATYCSTVVHESAAVATGIGTGSIAELILNGKLQKPGVWPQEQALSTDLFEPLMASRQMPMQEQWL